MKIVFDENKIPLNEIEFCFDKKEIPECYKSIAASRLFIGGCPKVSIQKPCQINIELRNLLKGGIMSKEEIADLKYEICRKYSTFGLSSKTVPGDVWGNLINNELKLQKQLKEKEQQIAQLHAEVRKLLSPNHVNKLCAIDRKQVFEKIKKLEHYCFNDEYFLLESSVYAIINQFEEKIK